MISGKYRISAAFILIALAAFCFDNAKASSSLIKVGIVGKISPFNGVTKPNSSDDLLLSLISDSLFVQGKGWAITPSLAESWPTFDERSATVTVKLREDRNTLLLPFEATDAAIALSKRIPDGYQASVEADDSAGILTFRFTDDISVFWPLFAFAPLWRITESGVAEGVGSPPYKIDSWHEGGCNLAPASPGSPSIDLIGYNNSQSIIEAFSSGEIDYFKGSMTKQAASTRGLNVQSDALVTVCLFFNSKSMSFADKSQRAAAIGAIDIDYLLLRTLQGGGRAAEGLYLTEIPSVEAGSPVAFAPKRISILVNSTDRTSIEMLCTAMIQTWWERAGATVSLSVPKTGTDLSAALHSGSYDALISSVWLEPAFRGLIKEGISGAESALTWGGWSDTDRQSLVKALINPTSFAEMSEAAAKIESAMLADLAVVPLIRPAVTELYRGELLSNIKPKPGAPLLTTLREIGSLKQLY